MNLLALLSILLLLDPSGAVQSSAPPASKSPLCVLNFKDDDIDHPVEAANRAHDENRAGINGGAEFRTDSDGSHARRDKQWLPAPRYKVAAVVVRNDSQKLVRAVEWDFVYLRKDKGRVSLRYTVKSEKKIKPGEAQTLAKHIKLPHRQEFCWHIFIQSPSSPPRLSIWGNTNMRLCEKVFVQEGWDREKATIRRVEYADGTVWQRDAP